MEVDVKLINIVIIIIILLLGISVIEQFDNPEKVSSSYTVIDDTNSSEYLLVTDQWIPYVTYQRDGLADILVFEALELAGITVKIEYYPWERCEQMILSGNAIGSYPWMKTDERELKYNFSDSIVNSNTSIFYFDEKFNDMTPQEILESEHHTIGVLHSYYYLDIIDFKVVDYSVNEVNAIEKLINKRTDLVVMENLNAIYIIKESFPDMLNELKYYDLPIEDTDFSILVDKNNNQSAEFIKMFNKGLETLINSGRYEEIIESYYGEFNEN